MSANSLPRTTGAMPFPKRGGAFRAFRSSSQSDWLATSLLAAKTITAGAECLPFPYVKGAFGMVSILLETVEKVQKNREDLRELCEDVMEIIKIIQDQISSHGDVAALKFKVQCQELEGLLQGVVKAVNELKRKPQGLSGRVKEIVRASNTTDEITGYQCRISELRSNFMFMATMDMNFQMQKALTLISPNPSATQVPQSINNCPPSSRIFHGRRIILEKMHQYFIQGSSDQHIFLLHGLGGAGKTQIALKFIEESSYFSDIFFIDTSTTGTIETGLKAIAATKNVGNTAWNALEWLKNKQHEWLLFFDNADDPKINLNDFVPQCKHGNIIITSRNPGLCVYAGSNSLVSDMEDTDAVELLLKSAALNNTDGNQKTAADIVKVLCYLPLAIIHAGAFISKSRNIENYLALYAFNRAQLLSEKPAQSHDNYLWTVYTTWEMSFKQLSQPAAKFLNLCSFLHREGISEQIFSNASQYICESGGPSKQELQGPLEFLSQFLGPNSVWDSLRFTHMTNEIISYSLINFDPDKKMFSIHPLVHDWSRDTLSDPQSYHYSMAAIVGMSIAALTEEKIRLDSLSLLPHIDFLLEGTLAADITLDFRHEYAKVYQWSAKPRRAEELQTEVLEKWRTRLGEDHPDTLQAMYWLSWAYQHQSQWSRAEELKTAVLNKRQQLLGDEHPDTLQSMENLAKTYNRTGKLKEAEELRLIVLEKTKQKLGGSHLETLTAMSNLGSTYSYLGKHKEAVELELIVLEKRRKVLGDTHPDTLDTMSRLALLYGKLGKLRESEKLGVAVLKTQSNVLGENHSDTLRTMGNLSVTKRELGKLKEAEELQTKVLEKRREFLDKNSPAILTTMGQLVATYIKLGKFKEAEELVLVLVERRKNHLGDNIPDTLNAMGYLAATYRGLGKLNEAQELEVVALEKRRNMLGDNHPHTILSMRNLASTYNKLGKLKEAEALEVVVWEKQRHLLGDNHPETLCTMGNLSVTYQQLGKLEKAMELQTIVLKEQRQLLGDNHPDTLWTMGNLASTYSSLDKLKEAEELENLVLKKQTDLLGKDHPDTVRTRKNLASTYNKLGRLGDAEGLNM